MGKTVFKLNYNEEYVCLT